MNRGFYIIMAAQFFSSLADNALLVAAIALLMQADAPSWLTPYLKFFFVISYVVLAPYVGAFADRLPKGQVMFIANTIKIVGCVAMLLRRQSAARLRAGRPGRRRVLAGEVRHPHRVPAAPQAGGRQRLDRGPDGGLDHPRHGARRRADPRARLRRAAALRPAAASTPAIDTPAEAAIAHHRRGLRHRRAVQPEGPEHRRGAEAAAGAPARHADATSRAASCTCGRTGSARSRSR